MRCLGVAAPAGRARAALCCWGQAQLTNISPPDSAGRRPLQAWDVNTLQCLRTLEGHEDNVRVLAVGRGYLFSGSWDKTVRVWSAETLACVKVRGRWGQWWCGGLAHWMLVVVSGRQGGWVALGPCVLVVLVGTLKLQQAR